VPGRSRALPPYLVLLRVGFALPAALLPRRCALTAPFHPYPAVVAGSQGHCHPEERAVCAPKDPGEPRDASRVWRRHKRAFGSLPFKTLSPRNDGGAVCFLWHFPSSRLEPAVPDVIRHTALRSSDFPLLASEDAGSDRPVRLPTGSLYAMLCTARLGRAQMPYRCASAGSCVSFPDFKAA